MLAGVFGIGLAAGSLLPVKTAWWVAAAPSQHAEASRPADRAGMEWPREGNLTARYVAEGVRVVDGDTFEARVHLWPGLDVTTRVRLRGIDAPELKAHCPREREMAEIARDVLNDMVARGGVAIFNVGPDKYNGRVVADVATPDVSNVSAALLAGGHVRAYGGGHRDGWCVTARR
ncbi:thermonuclease family protein [Afipia sp. TerB]